ncbi:MAG: hydantoinase/oxoprolinase N-terminal domain-containing protein, partial [Achromobacter mucicolens]
MRPPTTCAPAWTRCPPTTAWSSSCTTRGFRDSLELGRGNRPEAYNIYFKRLDPLVPRELRFELTERMNA